MKKDYLNKTFFFKEINKELRIEIPNTCPHCHETMNPEIIKNTDCKILKNDNIFDTDISKKIAIVFLCTSCEQFFLQPYVLKDSLLTGFKIEKEDYKKIIKKSKYDLNPEISSFSKDFIEIYTQAIEAERLGLYHLAGIGLRKSLEFLVKDYLINFIGEDKIVISKMQMSQAINKIESIDIKALALVITWLGNDEAHYKREFINKDIKDIKKVIKVLSSLMSHQIILKECHEMIGDKKSKNKK